MEEQSHTLISLVQDEPGVLTRVAGLFRRRGFNIESLSVGHCERPGLSRMTIVVKGDDAEVEQVTKQLDKLIEVVNVTDITREDMVTRELALFKVSAGPDDRSCQRHRFSCLSRLPAFRIGPRTASGGPVGRRARTRTTPRARPVAEPNRAPDS